jgi:hypothetical protein
MIQVPYASFSIRRDMSLVVSSSQPLHVVEVMKKVHAGFIDEDSIQKDDSAVYLIEPDGWTGLRDDRFPAFTLGGEWDRMESAYGRDPKGEELYRDKAFRSKEEFFKFVLALDVPARPRGRPPKTSTEDAVTA